MYAPLQIHFHCIHNFHEIFKIIPYTETSKFYKQAGELSIWSDNSIDLLSGQAKDHLVPPFENHLIVKRNITLMKEYSEMLNRHHL